MRRQDFALSYYAVLTQQDWDNLITSGCKRVLLSLGLARTQPGMLARLAGLNCHAVLRVEGDNKDSASLIASEAHIISYAIPVDAVILGVESDRGIDFRYGSADRWQRGAYAEIVRISSLITAIGGLGIKTVAPAMTWPPEMISEDGVLQPGRTSWARIVTDTYQLADGIGSHCGYVLGWDGNAINAERFKFGLKREAESWHKPLWIDECTFATDNDLLQMQCALELADIIMHSTANERVMLLSPFTSAGYPTAWPAAYLLKDPKAYELLSRWLSS